MTTVGASGSGLLPASPTTTLHTHVSNINDTSGTIPSTPMSTNPNPNPSTNTNTNQQGISRISPVHDGSGLGSSPPGIAATRLRETVRQGTDSNHSMPSPVHNTQIPGFLTQSVPNPEPYTVPNPAPFSNASFTDSLSRHPIYLSLARHSQSQSINGNVTGVPSVSNNLGDSLKQQANKEILVWVHIIEKYINPNAVYLSNSNTDYQLVRISNIWINLGLLVRSDYDRMHTNNTNNTTDTTNIKPVHNSNSPSDSPSEESDTFLSTLGDNDVNGYRDAIGVVLNCAKSILSSILPKELNIQYNSNNNSKGKYNKKVKKHKYLEAVCIVFILALIRKLLLKYKVPVGVGGSVLGGVGIGGSGKLKELDSGTEHIQLMVSSIYIVYIWCIYSVFVYSIPVYVCIVYMCMYIYVCFVVLRIVVLILAVFQLSQLYSIYYAN